MLSFTGAQLVRYLRTYTGYHEDGNNNTPFGKYWGINNGDWAAWCAMFIGYGMAQLGYNVREVSPEFYSTQHWYNQCKDKWAQVPFKDVQEGDILFIDWQSGDSDSIDHVCIATSRAYGLTVNALHGNLDNQVKEKSMHADFIAGILRPPYSVPVGGGGISRRPAFPGVTLARDSRGSSVTMLQRRLRTLGYKDHVTGLFDQVTARSVREFQQVSGLVVDGLVGPVTWGKLFA